MLSDGCALPSPGLLSTAKASNPPAVGEMYTITRTARALSISRDNATADLAASAIHGAQFTPARLGYCHSTWNSALRIRRREQTQGVDDVAHLERARMDSKWARKVVVRPTCEPAASVRISSA